MSPDVYKHDAAAVLLEYPAVVAGHVDTSAAGKSLLDRMIVEQRVKWFSLEEPQALIALRADADL